MANVLTPQQWIALAILEAGFNNSWEIWSYPFSLSILKSICKSHVFLKETGKKI